MTNTRRKLKH